LTPFWIKWLLAIFLIAPPVMFIGIAKGYVMLSKGKDIGYNLSKGLLSNIMWVLELVDQYKDFIYFYAFRHSLPIQFVLAFSMTTPFALVHSNGKGKNRGLAENLMLFQGLINDEEGLIERFGSTVIIALFENIP
jgi:hypothetical protein